ncbi:3-hydroxyacyl-CoA dehydrogenase family protein [Paenibacillus barcinonensis]|uniref:3-hydroxyacyl-CoA dehydrogenase family protein n=1 Tax=Paenibacillus barcinonensis TaxID=198119 RepID=A0A2V4VFM8_PAEBA|nr:3-hydroxyacyl-CoA dehydrogenase family protein [Paenibacillus barcinonensis]PYE47526.1 3-hydroxybutyryl-CoA dehydrogenase [Paenibacillus barcinonensis]QKS56436.1 3-hydroxyacyl-CoA dehydrogenase family protein [Paenibacillus barcinonensis]
MHNQLIAIIGAGVMGCATALDVARAGYQVILQDHSESVIALAPDRIRREYRSACFLQRGYGEVSLDVIMDRISLQIHDAGVEEAGIIIENVTEHLDSKREVYARLSHKAHPEALYALNTSCISVTKLASYLPDPGRAIGVHLMNPVPVKTMVEVIKGQHTTLETEQGMVAFLESLGKNPVVIEDLPGFVSNRLSHLLMNEAAFIVQDGIATAEQVDAIMKKGFNYQMGPLETADLIGLDTVVHSLKVLYDSYQDPKFRCCPMLQKMVDAGQWGRKTGQGFYAY